MFAYGKHIASSSLAWSGVLQFFIFREATIAMLASRVSQRSSAFATRQFTALRSPADRHLFVTKAEEKPGQRTVETEGDREPVTSEWEAIDDRIRKQVYSDDWEDTLPLPFIAAVSTFGTALTGVQSSLSSARD